MALLWQTGTASDFFGTDEIAALQASLGVRVVSEGGFAIGRETGVSASIYTLRVCIPYRFRTKPENSISNLPPPPF